MKTKTITVVNFDEASVKYYLAACIREGCESLLTATNDEVGVINDEE